MLPPQLENKVKELLQRGQKSEAIEILCKEHQLALPDAKVGFNTWLEKLRVAQTFSPFHFDILKQFCCFEPSK
jgi:hypothetical protein